MKKDQFLILKKIFELNCEQELTNLVEGIGLADETGFKIRIDDSETDNKIVINYIFPDTLNKGISLCISAGLPNAQFDEALKVFAENVKQYGDQYTYHLKGHLLGGSLAQYAGIMSEGFELNYQVTGFNSFGLENLIKFRGNEFFGYKVGLLQHIDAADQKNMYQMKSMGLLKSALIDRGVIVYDVDENKKSETATGNISDEYRNISGERLISPKLKNVLIDILIEFFDKSEEESVSFVDKNYNYKIIERKMNLIDRYSMYRDRMKNNKNTIFNYVFSNNIVARLYKQLGTTYILDKDMKELKDSSDYSFHLLEKMEREQIEDIIKSADHLFEPFTLLSDDGNGQSAKNRFGEKPVIGQLTNRISNNYLQALLKDIIVDISKIDEDLIKEIFKTCQKKNHMELQKILEDRLYYSMKKRGLIEEDINFHSNLLLNEPDLFSEMKKIYPLDKVVIEQLKQMYSSEIRNLWKWKLSAEGIFLILGSELNSEEVKMKYHSSSLSFDNKLKEIKLQLNKPSQNKIYGSLKKIAKQNDKLDIDYHYKEDMAYNFSSKQGVGFDIISEYTDPELGIKVDGQDISKQYREKDREEADIGSRTKTLRDKYFGENIILSNSKRVYGELSGELIYIYGSEKQDQLIIEGFANGDYGIELKEKIKEKKDDVLLKTYSDQKIMIDCVQFVNLKELVIRKSIYDHTRVSLNGVIKEENADKFRKYLTASEDPQIVLSIDNEDNEILFKGIIDDYHISFKNFDYYLDIEAVSYSILLDREKHTRIYQNIGTSYNDIFAKLSSFNDKFNISFVNSCLGDTPLVSEKYPVVIQCKETDWEFVKRISSYLDKVLIVDDCKDISETINIQVGFHKNRAVDLNNAGWAKCKKTGPRNTIYRYHQVQRHEHFRSDWVFQIGKNVNLTLNHNENKKVEIGIIKNKIFLDRGVLYSDITLAREEDINMLNKQRKFSPVGRSYRAEVKDVNNKHQAKVKFIDIEDDFEKEKAYWFPIDKIYTESYFSPEIGDIVDIYFKSKNEKNATLHCSNTDKDREIDINPADKTITTSGGYLIRLNNNHIYIASKDEKAVLEITDKEIKMTSCNNHAFLKKNEIELKTKKGKAILSKNKTELSFGSKKVEIKGGKISLQ
ncbi:MAG: hypothetical protein ACOC1N_05845 [Bacillota bacterium]